MPFDVIYFLPFRRYVYAGLIFVLFCIFVLFVVKPFGR